MSQQETRRATPKTAPAAPSKATPAPTQPPSGRSGHGPEQDDGKEDHRRHHSPTTDVPKTATGRATEISLPACAAKGIPAAAAALTHDIRRTPDHFSKQLASGRKALKSVKRSSRDEDRCRDARRACFAKHARYRYVYAIAFVEVKSDLERLEET